MYTEVSSRGKHMSQNTRLNDERTRLTELIMNNIEAGNVADVPCGLYDDEDESSDSSSN